MPRLSSAEDLSADKRFKFVCVASGQRHPNVG
jgi:hypothetical protein